MDKKDILTHLDYLRGSDVQRVEKAMDGLVEKLAESGPENTKEILLDAIHQLEYEKDACSQAISTLKKLAKS